MSNSPRSSSGSAPCRLEWRPSRWLLAALLLLSLLAPLAVLGSELPRYAAWPLAVAACLYGLWLTRREAGRAPRQLVLRKTNTTTDAACDSLDGQPLQACRLAWRGPLAFVHAIDRNGRDLRLAWWPDTLPPGARRELRLAAATRAASRRQRSMAP